MSDRRRFRLTILGTDPPVTYTTGTDPNSGAPSTTDPHRIVAPDVAVLLARRIRGVPAVEDEKDDER